MSIEGASYRVGQRDGEGPTLAPNQRLTTATHIYRCLHVLGINWGENVASHLGLAKAIAKIYNDIKHADRGDFPDLTRTSLVAVCCRWIVRLLAVNLAGNSEHVLDAYRQSAKHEIARAFADRAMRIEVDGTWTEITSSDAA